jgi:hypothetical protein
VEAQLRSTHWKEFAQEGVRPSYNTNDYSLCRIVADSLPLRQSTLTEWASKFTRLSDHFATLIREHDQKFNISGKPWKGESDHSCAEPEVEEQQWPAALTVPKADVDKEGLQCTVASHNASIKLVFTNEKRLYLQAVADVVVPSSECLLQVYGDYLSGPEVKQRADVVGENMLWTWAVSSLDYEAFFRHPESWSKSFTPKCTVFDIAEFGFSGLDQSQAGCCKWNSEPR